MKSLLCSLIVLLLFPFVGFSSTEKKEDFLVKKLELTMEQASLDIMDNITLWIALHNEVDEVSEKAWLTVLGNKLPSQPIGVISVIAELPDSSQYIEALCPRGQRFPWLAKYDYMESVNFAQKSMNALESFTLVDSKKESIRKSCLKLIKKRYSLWRQKSISSGEAIIRGEEIKK